MPRLASTFGFGWNTIRFGNRPHNIDTTVRTYQLTPEQLKRLKNGENLDDILKECRNIKEEKMARKKIDLTVEEYVEMVEKGMSDDEIAEEKGITKKQLYHWKYPKRKRIEQEKAKLRRQLNGEKQEAVKEVNCDSDSGDKFEVAGIKETKQETKQAEENGAELDKLRERLAQLEEECNWLRSEVQRLSKLTSELLMDRHKNEWDKAIEELKVLVQQSRKCWIYELFKLTEEMHRAVSDK